MHRKLSKNKNNCEAYLSLLLKKFVDSSSSVPRSVSACSFPGTHLRASKQGIKAGCKRTINYNIIKHEARRTECKGSTKSSARKKRARACAKSARDKNIIYKYSIKKR